MKVIDLNVDCAEGAPYDEELLGLVSTANICCGAHAGSTSLAKHVAGLCRTRGVRICAHPGYPDREGMGRNSQPLESPEDSAALLKEITGQIGVLTGVKLVKPHGALYHDMMTSEPHAAALTAILLRTRCDLVGFPVGLHTRCAKAAGVKFHSEGFADRGYQADGRLIPRSKPGALLEVEAEIRKQVLRLAGAVDTICLHSDTPNCLEIARLARATLLEAGWTIAPR